MATATDHDLDVQTLVRAELIWTPDIDAAAIGVEVKDGAVTLSGAVDTLAEKLAAEKAAFRVRGVRALVNALEVKPKVSWWVGETDVAQEVDHALRAASNVPETVKATIVGHSVTLLGEVSREFQRRAAEHAVRNLRGVFSLTNLITLAERPSAPDTEKRIREAIGRNAQLDADSIHVAVDGNVVRLTGTVRSWAERHQAAEAAWASPHVTEVQNDIDIVG
jgi:osmotically-inducible protein OsmY